MLDATPLLRVYARARLRRLAALVPPHAQERQLLALVRRAAATRFGRAHGFDSIRSVAGFQERVPLRRYEDFWEDYWKPAFPMLTDLTWPGTIPFFAVSSGTSSGRTKYIPCTHAMNRANERAALDVLTHHIANRPASRVLGGKSFMLGGSTALVELAPGVYQGDLSGIAARELPRYARPLRFPALDIALIADWEEKLARLAELAPRTDIRVLTGTPSWVLILFDKLAEAHPERERRAIAYWPKLELLVHGGVNFAPYRQRFEDFLAGSHAELREVYPASEGFVALADRGPGEGLQLLIDNGIFFEFVPVEMLDGANPVRHWAGTLETGVDYAVVLSTNAGLWAYILGDTVRFVDRDPPRLVITGRTSYYLSAFGEHMTGEEIEAAVAGAARAIGASVTDFSVGALYPQRPGELGGHLYIVEFAEAPPDPQRLEAFARAADGHICEANNDYRDHRAGGFGLNPPRIHAVPPGTFAAWMKRRGRLGGQNKVPRIITDPELFRDLRRFTGAE